MAPEISCRATINFIIYFEKAYGRERLERAYTRLGSSVPLAYILEPKNWVSLDFSNRLLEVLAEESGDSLFERNSGRFVATPQALGFAYYLLRTLGSVRAAYEKIVSVGPSFNKTGRFHIEQLEHRRLLLTYRSDRKETNKRPCDLRIGQFAAVPTIWGLPEATVREHRCQAHGDDDCLYEFTWLPVSRAPQLLGVLGTVAGAGAGLLLSGSADAVLGAATGLSSGTALGLWLDSRRKSRLLETQSEGLTASMRELSAQVEEIRQLNASLEQKVQARTQELSLASARLRTALEKQLELDRLKTHFFQNVSHELRTPLTLILAPLDTVSRDESLPEEAKMQVDVARRSAVRLLNLINGLLDLGRLDSGKVRLSLTPQDPALVCRQLVENAQPLAAQRGIDLRYAGAESLPDTPLDGDKFEKILTNLLSNALKFTVGSQDRPAQVRVRADVVDGRLEVSVEDTGIGIPEAERERIFHRFHQVDGSDVRPFEGTGIGLSLVRELTELHCGEVSVASQEGVGSVFTVRLPLTSAAYPAERLDRRRGEQEVAVDRRDAAERQKLRQLIANPAQLALEDIRPPPAAGRPPAPRRAAADASPAQAEDERRRILVVDDNRDMLTYLSTILGREYDVLTAADGEEAFLVANREVPHLVVSDVMMPRRNGYELVRDLKAQPHTQSIPIILVTAKAEAYHKVTGLESGADDYLTKPFNFLELRARIRQLLRTRALERTLAEKNDRLAKLNFDLVLSKKEVFLQTIEALAFALEAKDPYTHGHSRRVSLLSAELAQAMSLSELEIERVRIGAVLHDIGKLGIPEHILGKEGRLNAEEEAIIRRHPEIGYRILESVKELAPVNRCILMHHEHFDGTGYPGGLRGHDIPLGSRIIAVADTYDAMTSDRPYRKSLGHDVALEELRRYSGTQFDPDCVRAFLQRYERRAPVFPDIPSVLSKLRA